MNTEQMAVPEVTLDDLMVRANNFAELTAQKKDLKNQLEGIEELLKSESQEMLTIMRAKNLDKFSTTQGTFFTYSIERPSIVDQAKAFAYLREIGLGDIIRETVNSNTLLSEYGVLRAAGKIDIFSAEEKGIKVSVKEEVRVKK